LSLIIKHSTFFVSQTKFSVNGSGTVQMRANDQSAALLIRHRIISSEESKELALTWHRRENIALLCDNWATCNRREQLDAG